MALKGTLKDFGIADILQLIAQQAKSGELNVRTRGQQVTVWFVGGNIVGAEENGRIQKDMLGSMMVRANELTEAELDYCLEIQRRTGRRLGEILLEATNVSVEGLRDFAELQTTETVYKLFLWETGQYSFSQQESDDVNNRGVLISGEHILMEGFRQLDEWPLIRRQIRSYAQTYVRIGELPRLQEAERIVNGPVDFETTLFQRVERAQKNARNIGPNERKVFALIAPGHDVQRIIDLSRLGEFETCRAICHLLSSKLIAPSDSVKALRNPTAEATVGGIIRRQRSAWIGLVGVMLVTAGVIGLLVKNPGPIWVDIETFLAKVQGQQGHQDTRLLELVSGNQVLHIEAALELYRTQYRNYPDSLARLVEVDLLRPRDLNFPWEEPFYYQATASDYRLLRPLR